ncbi:MAG TPA: transporter substrate-binding protein [Polyangiaceae bacterium]
MNLRPLAVSLLACLAACAASPKPKTEPAFGQPTEPVSPSAEPALPLGTELAVVPAEINYVRVGVLHSLTGTMAVEETQLMNAALMAIDDINENGGVLGQGIMPLTHNPASNWPLFAEKAREVVQKEHARVVFGGYTSVSRKSMLPVFEELGGLLFYPAQHEGDETSRSIVYTGSIPNQSVTAVADYLARRKDRPIKRWFVIGTDYVVPRVQAKAMAETWRTAGVRDDNVSTVFTPFRHSDYTHVVDRLKKFSSGAPTAVISLLFRESAAPFQEELARQNVSPRTTAIVHFGLDEREVAKSNHLFTGTFLARSYFSTIDTPQNAAFKRLVAKYARDKALSPDELSLNDDVEATYIGVNLWKQAVESAKSFDTTAVTAALANQTFDAPSGFTVSVDKANHHLHKPYFLAEVDATGSVNVVWKTPDVIPPIAPALH